MEKTQQFCTFWLKDQLLGIPAEQVQEVIQLSEITPVPLVSDIVRGLINLRGQIVATVDLRRRLGIGDRPTYELTLDVIVRTSEGPVSLLVDAVGDVVEVRDETFEYPPATLDANSRELIRGVHKLDGSLMLVLDSDKACALPEPKEDACLTS